jgi:hypothetical protein
VRATERMPWGERRDVSHDELCMAVVDHASDLLLLCLDSVMEDEPALRLRLREQFAKEAVVEVERYVAGRGFVDVAIDIPECDGWQTTLVECKTNRENWSAGDVIRQLKYYRSLQSQSPNVRVARLVLVVDHEGTRRLLEGSPF